MSERYDLVLNKLNSVRSVKDARVIEIGGSNNLYAAKQLIDAGAIEVHVTNIEEDVGSTKNNNSIFYKQISAEFLDTAYPENYFDSGFGTWILEHLPNLDTCLESIYKVVKPGAPLFLTGGPLWSCKKGHHVYYDGKASKYTFNNSNGGYDPMPFFGHLTMSEAQLSQALISKGLPDCDASGIAKQVLASNMVNRQSYKNIVNALIKSRFMIASLESPWIDYSVSTEWVEKIKTITGDESDCRICNVHALLIK